MDNSLKSCLMKEIYDIDPDYINTVSTLCLIKYGIDWTTCIYMDIKDFVFFYSYLIRKYRISVNEMEEFYTTFCPSNSKNEYDKNIEKVKNDPEIMVLLSEITNKLYRNFVVN